MSESDSELRKVEMSLRPTTIKHAEELSELLKIKNKVSVIAFALELAHQVCFAMADGKRLIVETPRRREEIYLDCIKKKAND